MRIIGGTLRGRRIDAPPGDRVRPTSDRVREAVFNILGPPPPMTRVLDVFAGAGSLGLEALSRGADQAVFIDSARVSIRCVERNIQTLGVAERSRVHCADALALLRRWHQRSTRAALASGDRAGHERFRWLFVDPPYRSTLAHEVLQLLATGSLLTPDAVIVVEHDRRNCPATSYGTSNGSFLMMRSDRRKYGDTEISLYHHDPASSDENPVS